MPSAVAAAFLSAAFSFEEPAGGAALLRLFGCGFLGNCYLSRRSLLWSFWNGCCGGTSGERFGRSVYRAEQIRAGLTGGGGRG